MFFPIRCLLCKKPSHQKYALCTACESQLPYLSNTCIQCATILTADTPKQFCGECLKNPPFFDKSLALFSYEDTVIKLITDLKFHQEISVAKLLAHLFCEYLLRENRILPDLLIPVPLHIKRLKQRGFNQAVEIAKPIAKKFNIALSRHSCTRIRATTPQIELPAEERKSNMKNAFNFKKSLEGLNIAIIDDVMTTGNTVNELSRCLKKAGAKQVEIWCCARTIFKK